MSKIQFKEIPTEYYTINNFKTELKSIMQINNSQNNEDKKINKVKYNTNTLSNNNKHNFSQLRKNFSNINSDIEGEITNFEINNIKSENEELKFCLNSIIKFIDKKIMRYSKISSNNEQKILHMKKEINNQNTIIQNLNNKKQNLEKIISGLNKNTDGLIVPSNNNEEYSNILQENNKLSKEIKEKNILMTKYQNELRSKNESFKEIDKLKKEKINNQQRLNKLNEDKKKRNELITKLKSNINNNINENMSIEKENEQLKKEINDINEKNELLSKEIEQYKNNILLETSNNQKIEDKINETNSMIKEAKESQKKIKEDYENKIISLINKYENEINSNKKMNTINNLEKENNQLKNMNKELNIKVNAIYNIKNKYDKLMQKINDIKEENELLKNKVNKTKKKNSFTKYLNYKDVNITFPSKKLNNTSYNDSNNNIFIDNTIISDDHDFQTSPNLVGHIYKKNFPFDRMKKSQKGRKNYSESKKPTLSSLIISDTSRKDLDFNEEENINDKKYENNNNEEFLSEDEINQNFNLYKPLKEGLLVFNLAKKVYYIVVPEKYSDFWEDYNSDGSLLYNTLEGLFLINSKNNQLYYYSSKKNIFCDLLTFKESHSYGCLFVDNLSKNIIAIGGKFSKLVELFSFETGKIEDLPELSTHRSKMTCCQVNNKIYCFFGISEERPNESLIEYLDLDDIKKGWIEINYINKTSFKILTFMSCVNLNDAELLIIGGNINDKISNEKLIYYNAQSNELYELDKDLPESDNKNYIFSQNIMFNLFLNGKIISFINIDDFNQVHIIDNELKYDLYLSPNL